MKNKMQQKRKTLNGKLISAFVLVALLPTLIIGIASDISSVRTIRQGVSELSAASLAQTRSSINAWISSYKDVLYQIYSDEQILELVEKLNTNEDAAVIRNQLRRKLRVLLNTKEHIKSITIITNTGETIFYDSLVSSNEQNSWMNTIGMTKEELLACVVRNDAYHHIATHKAATFAGKENYLFHIGHRIINYKNISAQYGIAVISIDEALLDELCNASSTEVGAQFTNYCFIVDAEGQILSYPEKQYIGEKISAAAQDEESRLAAYKRFVCSTKSVKKDYYIIQMQHDKTLDCDVVYVSDQSQLRARLRAQHQAALAVVATALLLLLLSVVPITRGLTMSIRHIVSVMRRAREGDLTARIEVDEKSPLEIAVIAMQYNDTMDQLKISVEKEREAYKKQRDAEMVALEAQINPHFIYNTLDTINWMAIDKEDYEIGDAITALAKIMRYSIDNCNGVVTVRDELKWLEQYIVLQKLRLGRNLTCVVSANEKAKNCSIHKLLLQPFVENSIRHGFIDSQRAPMLSVSVSIQGDMLIVDICDNGVGMPVEMVERIQNGIFPKAQKNHIGLENAVTRLHLYYGEKTMISVISAPNEGTEIIISLPAEEVAEL